MRTNHLFIVKINTDKVLKPTSIQCAKNRSAIFDCFLGFADHVIGHCLRMERSLYRQQYAMQQLTAESQSYDQFTCVDRRNGAIKR